MLRGALLGLGDTAGDALASKSPKLNIVPSGTEHDVSLGRCCQTQIHKGNKLKPSTIISNRQRELIAKGRAELERGLAALKSATSS
jgi:hypothetical protein